MAKKTCIPCCWIFEKKWILGPVTFFLFKSIYNNNSWDIDCEGLKLLLFGDVLHFYPPKNKKNQNFEKIKKIVEDITVLHMRTKNHNHMMYSSWDTERQTEFFVISDDFLSFYPEQLRKSKFWKNEKKHLDMSSFYTCVPKIRNHDMMYASWDWTISCPFTPNNTENQNLIKMKKSIWTCHHFTHVYQK